jgi:hypothetical protein
MKRALIPFVVATISAIPFLSAEEAKGKDTGQIGVYDSRAIAVAFVGSEVYDVSWARKWL